MANNKVKIPFEFNTTITGIQELDKVRKEIKDFGKSSSLSLDTSGLVRDIKNVEKVLASMYKTIYENQGKYGNSLGSVLPSFGNKAPTLSGFRKGISDKYASSGKSEEEYLKEILNSIPGLAGHMTGGRKGYQNAIKQRFDTLIKTRNELEGKLERLQDVTDPNKYDMLSDSYIRGLESVNAELNSLMSSPSTRKIIPEDIKTKVSDFKNAKETLDQKLSDITESIDSNVRDISSVVSGISSNPDKIRERISNLKNQKNIFENALRNPSNEVLGMSDKSYAQYNNSLRDAISRTERELDKLGRILSSKEQISKSVEEFNDTVNESFNSASSKIKSNTEHVASKFGSAINEVPQKLKSIAGSVLTGLGHKIDRVRGRPDGDYLTNGSYYNVGTSNKLSQIYASEYMNKDDKDLARSIHERIQTLEKKILSLRMKGETNYKNLPEFKEKIGLEQELKSLTMKAEGVSVAEQRLFDSLIQDMEVARKAMEEAAESGNAEEYEKAFNRFESAKSQSYAMRNKYASMSNQAYANNADRQGQAALINAFARQANSTARGTGILGRFNDMLRDSGTELFSTRYINNRLLGFLADGVVSARRSKVFDRMVKESKAYLDWRDEQPDKRHATVRNFKLDQKNVKNVINELSQSDESLDKMRNAATILNPALALAATGIQKLAGVIKDFTVDSIRQYEEIQSIKAQLGVVYETQGQANSQFTDIARYSRKSPFGVQTMAEQAILLKQSGISSTDLMDIMSRIGDISSGNAEKMRSISEVLARVVSSTTVTARDLRQLSTAGVPAYEALTQVVSSTTHEKFQAGTIRSMLQQGKVTSEDFINMIKVLTGKGGQFEGAVEIGARTFKARKQNLEDAEQLAKASLGERLTSLGATGTEKSYYDKFLTVQEAIYDKIEFITKRGVLVHNVDNAKAMLDHEVALFNHAVELQGNNADFNALFGYLSGTKASSVNNAYQDYYTKSLEAGEWAEERQRTTLSKEAAKDLKTLVEATRWAEVGKVVRNAGLGVAGGGGIMAATGIGVAPGTVIFGAGSGVAVGGQIISSINESNINKVKKGDTYKDVLRYFNQDELKRFYDEYNGLSDDEIAKMLNTNMWATNIGKMIKAMAAGTDAISGFVRAVNGYASTIAREQERYKHTSIGGLIESDKEYDRLQKMKDEANSFLASYSGKGVDEELRRNARKNALDNFESQSGEYKDTLDDFLSQLKTMDIERKHNNFLLNGQTFNLSGSYNEEGLSKIRERIKAIEEEYSQTTRAGYKERLSTELESLKKQEAILSKFLTTNSLLEEISSKMSFLKFGWGSSESGEQKKKTELTPGDDNFYFKTDSSNFRYGYQGSRKIGGSDISYSSLTVSDFNKLNEMFARDSKALDINQLKDDSYEFSEASNLNFSKMKANLEGFYEMALNDENLLEIAERIKPDSEFMRQMSLKLNDSRVKYVSKYLNDTLDMINDIKDVNLRESTKKAFEASLTEREYDFKSHNDINKSGNPHIWQNALSTLTGIAANRIATVGSRKTMDYYTSNLAPKKVSQSIIKSLASTNQMSYKEIAAELRKGYKGEDSRGNANFNWSKLSDKFVDLASESVKEVRDASLSGLNEQIGAIDELLNGSLLLGETAEEVRANLGQMGVAFNYELKKGSDGLMHFTETTVEAASRLRDELSGKALKVGINNIFADIRDDLKEKGNSNKRKSYVSQNVIALGRNADETNANYDIYDKAVSDIETLMRNGSGIMSYLPSFGKKKSGLTQRNWLSTYLSKEDLTTLKNIGFDLGNSNSSFFNDKDKDYYELSKRVGVEIDRYIEAKKSDEKGSFDSEKFLENNLKLKTVMDNLGLTDAFMNQDSEQFDKILKGKYREGGYENIIRDFLFELVECKNSFSELNNQILDNIKTEEEASRARESGTAGSTMLTWALMGKPAKTGDSLLNNWTANTIDQELNGLLGLNAYSTKNARANALRGTLEKAGMRSLYGTSFDEFEIAESIKKQESPLNRKYDVLALEVDNLEKKNELYNKLGVSLANSSLNLGAKETLSSSLTSRRLKNLDSISINRLAMEGLDETLSANKNEIENLYDGASDKFKAIFSTKEYKDFESLLGNSTFKENYVRSISSVLKSPDKIIEMLDILEEKLGPGFIRTNGLDRESIGNVFSGNISNVKASTLYGMTALMSGEQKSSLTGGIEKGISDDKRVDLANKQIDQLKNQAGDMFKNTGIDAFLSSTEAIGKGWADILMNVGDFSDLMKGVNNAILSTVSSLGKQGAQLLLNAGLTRIMGNDVKGGMVLIAASGLASTVSGLMSPGSDSKEDDETMRNYERLLRLKENLADLLAQARDDAKYYEAEMRNKKAISTNEALSTTTKVNDMILTPHGNFSTHPDDYIIAAKHPEMLNGGGSRGGLTVYQNTYNSAANDVQSETTVTQNGDGSLNIETVISSVVQKGIADGSYNEAFAVMQQNQKGYSTYA